MTLPKFRYLRRTTAGIGVVRPASRTVALDEIEDRLVAIDSQLARLEQKYSYLLIDA